MNDLDRKPNLLESSTLVVTNLVKLGGLIAGMNELLFKEVTDAKRLALIGVMLTGAQAIENIAMRVLKEVFGK